LVTGSACPPREKLGRKVEKNRTRVSDSSRRGKCVVTIKRHCSQPKSKGETTWFEDKGRGQVERVRPRDGGRPEAAQWVKKTPGGGPLEGLFASGSPKKTGKAKRRFKNEEGFGGGGTKGRKKKTGCPKKGLQQEVFSLKAAARRSNRKKESRGARKVPEGRRK